ncbi:MAG: hypothetical protein QXI93_02130 [Candidatus Methanomethylicia archaeon]
MKARVAFETNTYVIILSDEKLEIDLKSGAKAFLEYMIEEHKSLERVLGWALGHLFPRDIHVEDISRAYVSPEGVAIVEEKTPTGIKTVKVPELTEEQAKILVEAINKLLEEKKT